MSTAAFDRLRDLDQRATARLRAFPARGVGRTALSFLSPSVSSLTRTFPVRTSSHSTTVRSAPFRLDPGIYGRVNESLICARISVPCGTPRSR